MGESRVLLYAHIVFERCKEKLEELKILFCFYSHFLVFVLPSSE